MKNPFFSISIPAYKSSFLKDAIQSCFDQVYEDFEIVIVNDASPEDIDSIIDSFGDNRIKYYKNQTNNGALNVVDTWNQCLNYASGRYLICMGDDDKLLSNCLQIYYDLINRYPSLDVYHTRTMLIDERGDVVEYQEERPEWESTDSFLFQRWTNRWRQFIGDFCFRLDALKEQGGFYKLPLAWGSDDISAFRAAGEKGIANTQDFGFQYRVNSSTISNSGLYREKAQADILSKRWYETYINDSLVHKELHKNKCWEQLSQMVGPYHQAKVRLMIHYDLCAALTNIPYWIFNRRIYDISSHELFLIVKGVIKQKLERHAKR